MDFREFSDLKLSEIGIGTYLGNVDQETDDGYVNTIKKGVEHGINVIDSSLNYRYMQSERAISEALRSIARDKLVISTKGGFLPIDHKELTTNQEDPMSYIKRTFLDTGLVDEKLLSCQHSLDTKFIDWCFNKSLENLQTDFIDIYFLHNPEGVLARESKDKLYDYLKSNFRLLEEKVKDGKLKYYGLATWEGFRLSPNNPEYLNIKEIHNLAIEVGGTNHHFKFIELPYNLAMCEAYSLKNHPIGGENLSTFEACKNLEIYPYVSASLMQTRAIRDYFDTVKENFKVRKNVHVPIQFVRSTPGVGTGLIGMSKVEHLEENLEVFSCPHLSPEELAASSFLASTK